MGASLRGSDHLLVPPYPIRPASATAIAPIEAEP